MARALSSSRRAPPNSAVKPCSSTASSSTGVWIRLREPLGSSLTVPAAIASGTEATISWTPSSATRLSRNSSTSGKFSPVSTCITGNGMRAGANALRASSSITMESLPPENSSTGPLQLGDDLADDVDGLGLQRLQLAQPVVGRGHARGLRRFDIRTSNRIGSGADSPPVSAIAADAHRRQDRFGQLRAADDQVGQPRIGVVVDQRGAVQPAGRQPRGPGDGDRRGGVPLVHAAGVHVGVDLAADDGDGLVAGRPERHELRRPGPPRRRRPRPGGRVRLTAIRDRPVRGAGHDGRRAR